MPCNCDYLDPTQKEKNSLNILTLLQELNYNTGNFSPSYGRPTTLEKDTQTLCELCQKIDVSKFSLELQIWWRDHQRADRERLQKEVFDIKRLEERKKALEKLTDYEKQLLNIK